MKKFLLLAFALVVSSILFVSCEKDDNTSYYAYNTDIRTSSNSKCEAINNALKSRLGVEYNISESEAKAEWNSFLNSIDESSIVMAPGDSYTVNFCKMEVRNGRYEEGKVIGEKTWKGN